MLFLRRLKTYSVKGVFFFSNELDLVLIDTKKMVKLSIFNGNENEWRQFLTLTACNLGFIHLIIRKHPETFSCAICLEDSTLLFDAANVFVKLRK